MSTCIIHQRRWIICCLNFSMLCHKYCGMALLWPSHYLNQCFSKPLRHCRESLGVSELIRVVLIYPCSYSWSTFICKKNHTFKTLRPRQNGCHFADNIFKCAFLNENIWISINISQNFAPKGQINNITALVQVMAWHWPGDKPLSEPMIVSLLTHLSHSASMFWFIKTWCVTQ